MAVFLMLHPSPAFQFLIFQILCQIIQLRHILTFEINLSTFILPSVNLLDSEFNFSICPFT